MKNLEIYYYLKLHFKNCRTLDLPKGWSDTKHAGMNSQLWLVTGGSAYLQIGQEKYLVKKGHFCLLPENQNVAYGCNDKDGFQLWVVQFDSELLSGSLFDWINVLWVLSLSNEEIEKCIQLFKEMEFGHLNTKDITKNIEITGALYTLLAQHIKKSLVEEKKQEDQLGDTLRYIDAHMNEKITVEQLARRVSLHPNYFTYLFRLQLGVSPSKFIANTKIHYAQILLQQGNITIQQVANKIGMPDVQSFARFFKRHTSMTPRQYQQSFKGEKL